MQIPFLIDYLIDQNISVSRLNFIFTGNLMLNVEYVEYVNVEYKSVIRFPKFFKKS
jgi:hypothetical protein